MASTINHQSSTLRDFGGSPIYDFSSIVETDFDRREVTPNGIVERV